MDRHKSTPATSHRYDRSCGHIQVEPYVVAADVYAVPPHTGRGGWTWYTGSAAWIYRLIMESLLVLKIEVDKLRIAPCLPADWKGFKMHYRYRETVYHINVLKMRTDQGEMSMTVDGIERPDKAVTLIDDHREHAVEVRIPASRTNALNIQSDIKISAQTT